MIEKSKLTAQKSKAHAAWWAHCSKCIPCGEWDNGEGRSARKTMPPCPIGRGLWGKIIAINRRISSASKSKGMR